MPDAPLDLAIFDLDDTLIDFDRDRRLDHLAHLTGLPREAIHAAIWGSDFERAAEAGAYSRGEDYLRGFNERLGFELTRAQWVAARAAGMRVRPQMLELVRLVRERVPIALLTNNGALLHESLPELVPGIHALFGRCGHASYEFGARKPELAVFTRLCERHGVAPARTVFIDDDAEYIEGARAAGLHAVRYESAAQVREALVSLGLL